MGVASAPSARREGRSSHKLSPRFYGPFKVVERIGNVAYHLQLPPQGAHPRRLPRGVSEEVLWRCSRVDRSSTGHCSRPGSLVASDSSACEAVTNVMGSSRPVVGTAGRQRHLGATGAVQGILS